MFYEQYVLQKNFSSERKKKKQDVTSHMKICETYDVYKKK